jgi:AcrR family transcriptional regulator
MGQITKKRVSGNVLRRAVEKKQGRRERRRAEIHDRLFRAALKLFAERGFSATTIEDITEAADVGKGTFFNYFPSKEHLLTAFSEIRMDIIRGALAEARAGKESIHDILHRMYHELMREPTETQEMARSLLITLLASEPVRTFACRRMVQGREMTAEVMAIGQHRGEIRGDREPEELARLISQSHFGALLLWAIEPPSRVGPLIEKSFEQFWSGIEDPSNRIKRTTR